MRPILSHTRVLSCTRIANLNPEPPMRLLTCAVAAAICAACTSAPAQPPAPASASKPTVETLRIISDFDSPPFAYRDGMTRVGAEVDLAEAIAKEMGRKLEWIPMKFNFTAYTSALNSGGADAAISCISITPERTDQVSFTKPYARMGLAVAVRSKIDWQHNWFTDGLKDWRIVVMRGSTSERWARSNLAGRVDAHSSLDRMIELLKGSPLPTRSGRGGTCVIYDEVPLRWSLSKYSYRYEIVERGIETQRYGIAVRKENRALLDELNAALARLRKGKDLAAIREKWRDKAEGLEFFKGMEE